MMRPAGKSFVAVTWHDPHGTGKTSCLYEHELPHSCVMLTTYGWLMRQDEKGVSLVGEIIADGSMRDYTFVPHELIDEIETISIPAGKRRQRGARRNQCLDRGDDSQGRATGGVAGADARTGGPTSPPDESEREG